MIKYPEYPLTQGTKEAKRVNVEDYKIKGIVIPKGYVTNGADIPRIFWSFVPPYWAKYEPAVLLHDYLCDKEAYKEADYYFEQVLKEIEDSWKTKLMVFAVKLYHRFKYNVK